MLKVLLADDERHILDLLKTKIPWKKYGMEVVSAETNGNKALEFIQKHDVDIVFTDIKMPVMDGIQLIEKAKLIKPESIFVVLSSYDEFSLVKSAFKMGSKDYILKDNIMQGSMNDLLKNLQGSQLKMLNVKKSLKQYVIDQLADYHKSISSQKIMVSIISCISERQETAVRGILKRIEGEHHALWLFYDGMFVMVLVLEDHSAACVSKIRNTVWDNFNEEDKYTISFSDVGSFRFIDELYEQAQNRFEKLIFYSCEFLNLSDKTINIDAVVAETKVQLYCHLKRMEFCDVKEDIEYFFSLLETNQLAKAMVQNIILDVYIYILNHIFDYNLLPGGISYETNLIKCKLNGMDRLSEIKQWLIEQLDSIEKYYQQEKKEHLMELVKVYIENNFKNKLFLDEIARLFGISAGYLSRKFAEVNGVHFKEYINILRNETAKSLLKETDLNMTDICEKVGFENVEHFSRMFKKHTGLSPLKYRQYSSG